MTRSDVRLPAPGTPEEAHAFLSALLHRLATPLGTASTMLHALDGGAPSAQSLPVLDRSVSRLSGILDQARRWLDAHTTGRAPVATPVVDLTARLREAGVGVSDPTGSLDQARGMADPAVFPALCDELVANARAAGAETVTGTWTEENDEVHLMVEDDGPGWSPATAARAFVPFATLPEGAGVGGVGLARVAAWMHAWGGRAWGMDGPQGAHVHLAFRRA